MFAHNKRLQYTVRVSETNPGLANLMLETDEAGVVDAVAARTASDPDADPMTGAELGMGAPGSAGGATPSTTAKKAKKR